MWFGSCSKQYVPLTVILNSVWKYCPLPFPPLRSIFILILRRCKGWSDIFVYFLPFLSSHVTVSPLYAKHYYIICALNILYMCVSWRASSWPLVIFIVSLKTLYYLKLLSHLQGSFLSHSSSMISSLCVFMASSEIKIEDLRSLLSKKV